MLGIALVTLVVSVGACQPFFARVPVTFGCSSNLNNTAADAVLIFAAPPAVFAPTPRQCEGDHRFRVRMFRVLIFPIRIFRVPIADFAVPVFSRPFSVKED
jgi:hypothetical protein